MAHRVLTAPLTLSSPRQVSSVVSKTQQVTMPVHQSSEYRHATLHSGLQVSQLPATVPEASVLLLQYEFDGSTFSWPLALVFANV